MMAAMMQRGPNAQRGLALPVMLIMLAVMMVSSIYLLRSTHSTALTASNLAHEDALSKAADLGIHTAYDWLSKLADKSVLANDIPAAGYVATVNPAAGQGDPAFWQGSTKVWDANRRNQVEYVIHRMCQFAGTYNATSPANNCTLTAARQNLQAKTRAGDSLSSDAPAYQGKPQLHYLITARIAGARGANVMNQAVVMMGP